MNTEMLTDALNLLSDDILRETDAVRGGRRLSGKSWGMWLSVAASLMFAVFAAGMFLRGAGRPLLSVDEEFYGSMGFEGYMAYDVSELVNGNPWNEEAELSVLPVFKNTLSHDEHGYIFYHVDIEGMRELLLDVAGRLGLEPDALEITQKAVKKRAGEESRSAGGEGLEGYASPVIVTAEADGVKLSVQQDMTVTVEFDPRIALPEGYDFKYYAPYEAYLQIAEYLRTEYRDFIAFDEPELNLHGGDYNIYFEQKYDIEFFDGSGDITERIVNYNFNRVAFYGDGEGKLWLMRVWQPDLSCKMGDYPIITRSEAQELLLNGNFITTVYADFPREEYIAKAELVYRTDMYEEYFMPYYRFYVELPELEENGLKTYGAYYVPAVEERYLSNMPVWDGRFN